MKFNIIEESKTYETQSQLIGNQQAALEEQLRLRKALQDITNRIHAAQNTKQILVDLREGILNLFGALSITIYLVDKSRSEIYSMFLVGSRLKEIRLPVSNKSIAGYVANTGRSVNIADVYDTKELKSIDKELTFDYTWDKKSGFRTKQILAAPIFYEKVLKGVVQILNRKGENKFTEDEQGFLQEIADVLGIALHNQERFAKRRRTRFDYLITRGLIKEEELDSAWDEAREKKENMETFLTNRYKVSKDDLAKSYEEYFRCKVISFNEKIPIPGDLLKNLKKEFLRRELWVPIGRVDGNIHVIMDDPNNILKRDTIESILKTKAVKYDVALIEVIIRYINLFFASPESEHSISEILGRLETEDETEEEDGEIITESDSVIMQIVNKVINDACARRASDIHVEPNVAMKNMEIRYRIDGDCILYQTLPFSYRAAVVSRIKIMSNLDITVKRLPQDGKIKFRRSGGDEIELRVATIPTQGGVEDVVLRILAAQGNAMPLKDMALSERNHKELVGIAEKPYGMILCVGPTGSGKTTTLHAALRHINTPDRKIWTAEDPVEITQYGLRQVQVHPKIGFDFAAAMRSFLRADPDVIMVGEMRDFETAKIGVEASLTGHLVFSTLHTNSAPETVVRLLDMGIDPLNFADSLLGILAQRLVRTLCNKCKEAYHPTIDEYNEIVEIYGQEHFEKLNIPYTDELTLYHPKGCDICDGTGYRGRMAIHELLINTDQMKRLIQKHETVEALRELGISEGMTTLLHDGIQKALKGFTDAKQVRRVCIK